MLVYFLREGKRGYTLGREDCKCANMAAKFCASNSFAWASRVSFGLLVWKIWEMERRIIVGP